MVGEKVWVVSSAGQVVQCAPHPLRCGEKGALSSSVGRGRVESAASSPAPLELCCFRMAVLLGVI
jgi:hypothetical protein